MYGNIQDAFSLEARINKRLLESLEGMQLNTMQDAIGNLDHLNNIQDAFSLEARINKRLLESLEGMQLNTMQDAIENLDKLQYDAIYGAFKDIDNLGSMQEVVQEVSTIQSENFSKVFEQVRQSYNSGSYAEKDSEEISFLFDIEADTVNLSSSQEFNNDFTRIQQNKVLYDSDRIKTRIFTYILPALALSHSLARDGVIRDSMVVPFAFLLVILVISIEYTVVNFEIER